VVASAAFDFAICDCMSFDALAPHYRWMELVLAGGKLQRCRTAFLNHISPPESILICGEGNGRFLLECRRIWQRARILCADASDRMLSLAKRRLARHRFGDNGIEFLRADLLEWSPPKEAFDLIVTHFFLDCFRAEQLHAIIAKLATAARPKAAWLLADFQAPQSGLQRVRARMILKTMYIFFRIATRLPARTLTPPDSFLAGNRFVLRQQRVSEWGLLRSDLWERG
jgi:ubiquinone/menaquinone biosynthesis C-methylase UbiE